MRLTTKGRYAVTSSLDFALNSYHLWMDLRDRIHEFLNDITLAARVANRD